jgi:drug/metabolite transporter (DMT)-like permease
MNGTKVKPAIETKLAPSNVVRDSHAFRYDLLLIFVTMIWGSTFLVTKTVIKFTGPFPYLALMYAVAALALALVFHRRLAHITGVELFSGLIIGIFLFTGYA